MSQIEKTIKMFIQETVDERLAKQKYTCVAKGEKSQILVNECHFSLPFVPFVGLVIKLNNGGGLSGRITEVEWDSSAYNGTGAFNITIGRK